MRHLPCLRLRSLSIMGPLAFFLRMHPLVSCIIQYLQSDVPAHKRAQLFASCDRLSAPSISLMVVPLNISPLPKSVHPLTLNGAVVLGRSCVVRSAVLVRSVVLGRSCVLVRWLVLGRSDVLGRSAVMPPVP